MALQKQTITFNFGMGGLDQKTDPKLLQPVRFSDLQDARFTKSGRIEKRRCFEQFGTFSATVLRLLDNEGQLYAISATAAEMPHLFRFGSDGAVASRLGTDVMPVGELVATQFGPAATWSTESISSTWSYAQSDNYFAVAYGSDTSGVAIELYNRATGSLVSSNAINGGLAQILAHPDGRDEFVIGYASGTTVSFRMITPSTTPVVLAGLPDEGTVSSLRFDAAVCADGAESTSAMIAVIYAKGASGVKLRNAAWPGAGGSGSTKSSTTIATATSTTLVAMASFANPSDTGANFRPMWTTSSGGTLISGTYNHSLTVQLAPATLATITAPATLAGVVFANGTAHAWYGGSGLGFITALLVNTSNTATSLGGVGGGGLGRMSQMLSRPMGVANGASYLWGSYSFTTNQNTAFLIGAGTSAMRITGRAMHLRSWTNAPLHSPPCSMVRDLATDEIVTIVPRLNRSATVVGGDSASGNWGFCRTIARPQSGWRTSKNRELLTTGGWGGVLNGVDAPIPTSPLIFPTIKTSSWTSSGGALTVGSYFVSGFFEMIDDHGLIRRSEPAEPVQVAVSGTQVAFSVTVSNYNLLDGLSGRVRFVATRTLVNESQVYYRDTSYSTTSTTSAIAVSFTQADATIAAFEPMYTAGGIAEDSAASALLCVASNGKRTLGVFGDDPNFVVESKPERANLGTAFMDGVGKRISTGGSRIYALASYSDRWFAFKPDGVFIATGDGADPSGQNDTLSEFEQLPNYPGCVEPKSVLVTSAGIVYLSTRGFYLIGGDLAPRYIGADVERFVSQDVLASNADAFLVDACYDSVGTRAYGSNIAGGSDGYNDDTGGLTGDRCFWLFRSDDVNVTLVLTIFTTADGADLRWSIDTITRGISNIVSCGGRVYGSIFTDETYTQCLLSVEANESSTAQYASSIDVPWLEGKTAWLHAGDIQGFGRAYKATALGYVPSGSSSSVVIYVGYNLSNTWAEIYTIASSAMQNGQFEIPFGRQKFEAIRLWFTVYSDTTSPGFMPSQIKLTVGIKDVTNKLPASAKATRI